MATPQRFRSAFNGFNREDVVNYIEYIHNKHKTQTAQLKSDIQQLQQQLAQVQAAPAAQADGAASQVKELEAKCLALEAERDSYCAQLAQVQQALAQAQAERDAAVAQAGCAQRRNDEELEAYRRAERMERQAKERADQLCHRVNGVLADESTKLEASSAQLAALADQVSEKLAELTAAAAGSKQLLSNAAAAMTAVQSEQE